jgi:hypothetical protein
MSRARLKSGDFARNGGAVISARSLVASSVGAAFGVASGCATQASTTLYTPITGIQIPAAVVVTGHGCGTRPGQVYKYAAIVTYPVEGGAATVTSGVFDCFADGIFANLPTIDGGTFRVNVYAFSQGSFPPALACSPPNSVPCPGDDAGSVAAYAASADWTAECTATQVPGITTVASCGSLEPSDAAAAAGDATQEATGADETRE